MRRLLGFILIANVPLWAIIASGSDLHRFGIVFALVMLIVRLWVATLICISIYRDRLA